AAAALLAVGRDRRPLEIAGVADRNRDLLVSDQIFECNLGGFVLNLSAALVAILLLDFLEFFHDHVAKPLLGREDGLVLCNAIANLAQLFLDFVGREPG